MTKQIPDKISVEGQPSWDLLPYEFMKTPLWPAIEADNALFQRVMAASPGRSTALYRGYVGHWRISKAVLCLDKIEVPGQGGIYTEISAAELFPRISGDVAADWFTGPIFVEDRQSGIFAIKVEAGIAKGIAVVKPPPSATSH